MTETRMIDKCVLITGAARRVGAAMALDLADRGYFVWAHYYQSERDAHCLCDEIVQNGGRAEPIRADLRDCSEIRDMFNAVAACPPDTLILNSSLFLGKNLLSTTAEEWDEVFSVNLKAAWYASLCFAEIYPCSARRVILIGDANTGRGYKEHAVYGLSKASLGFLMRQLAEALAPKIRVNMISPSFLLRAENESDSKWNERRRRALIVSDDPLNDFIQTLHFLLSDDLCEITGQNFVIDGGMGLWNQNY